MRIVRIALAVSLFACGLFLYFTVSPNCGTFQLLSTGLSEANSEYTLVFMRNKQIAHAILKQDVKLGWSGFKAASHFTEVGILFGILIGFPIGELSRRMFAIDLEVQKARDLKLSAVLKEISANSTMENAKAICADYPQLKKNAAEDKMALFVLRKCKSDLEKDNQKLQQRIESGEKELSKARGKIRRLEGQIERGKAQKPLTCQQNQHKLG